MTWPVDLGLLPQKFVFTGLEVSVFNCAAAPSAEIEDFLREAVEAVTEGGELEEMETFLGLTVVCSGGLDERMGTKEILASEDVLGRVSSCCLTGKASCPVPEVCFTVISTPLRTV